jgi:hypothetical protein
MSHPTILRTALTTMGYQEYNIIVNITVIDRGKLSYSYTQYNTQNIQHRKSNTSPKWGKGRGHTYPALLQQTSTSILHYLPGVSHTLLAESSVPTVPLQMSVTTPSSLTCASDQPPVNRAFHDQRDHRTQGDVHIFQFSIIT